MDCLFIPYLCHEKVLYESPAKVHNSYFLDGSLTDASPPTLLDPNTITITISTSPGMSNISPERDGLSYWSTDLHHVLSNKEYEKIFIEGYRDGKGWLEDMVDEGVLSSAMFRRLPGT